MVVKLRIRGNSLRLRLSQGEVARVGEGSRVEESISFGPRASDRLVYALVSSSDAETLRASFDAGEVRVTVPAAMARSWATGDDVGLACEQAVSGGVLKILVEKDFACLKPRDDEDETDAYPNPELPTRGC